MVAEPIEAGGQRAGRAALQVAQHPKFAGVCKDAHEEAEARVPHAAAVDARQICLWTVGANKKVSHQSPAALCLGECRGLGPR